MTSGHISSGLNLNYAPSTITKQQPTEGELDLLFEAMYDDYFGGQPSATVENVPPVQEPQGSLWDYWKLGSAEIKPTNDETFNLEETDHDDEQDIGEIFRTETNLFDYETLLCEEFKEFNYLLKIDPDLLTEDIKGFKTYEEFKDDWIYKDDGYCNGGNLPRAYIIGNLLHYQDYEWYEALEDGELKEESLRNKAIMEGTINDDELRYK
nr:hypothetical protein [Tanacetum cinerariifolium]